MSYTEKLLEWKREQLGKRKNQEDSDDAFNAKYSPYICLGEPPRGFPIKRCPLCNSRVNKKESIPFYNLRVWLCSNPDCEYFYVGLVYTGLIGD